MIEISSSSDSEDRSGDEQGKKQEKARVRRSSTSNEYVERDVDSYRKFRELLAELELRCDEQFLRLEMAGVLRSDDEELVETMELSFA